MDKEELDPYKLLSEVKDIVRIVKLKEQLQSCAEKDHYFEINGDSAKLLWEYIEAMEEAITLQD